MKKYALAMLMVKEMERRHPYLQQVGAKFLNY
jgi:hypothetical protein